MKKLIICNLKMNKTLEEMQDYIKQLEKSISANQDLVFCPSNIYLSLFQNKPYTLGAQDITAYEHLNLTGEIGALQLKSLNCQYVIIGHYERRMIIKETNNVIHSKILNALNNNLKPIICLGELNNLHVKKQLEQQLDELFQDFTSPQISKMIIGYEPIKMINSNQNINVSEIEENIKYIKAISKEKYKINNIPVLYGGNVNLNNIIELKKSSILDGFLLGRTCLKVSELKKIVE